VDAARWMPDHDHDHDHDHERAQGGVSTTR
jgi:hypothetical protein